MEKWRKKKTFLWTESKSEKKKGQSELGSLFSFRSLVGFQALHAHVGERVRLRLVEADNGLTVHA